MVVPVKAEQADYLSADEGDFVADRARFGGIDDDAAFKAVEEQERPTDRCFRFAAAAREPSQVRSARLRGDVTVGRPIPDGGCGPVGSFEVDAQLWVDERRVGAAAVRGPEVLADEQHATGKGESGNLDRRARRHPPIPPGPSNGGWRQRGCAGGVGRGVGGCRLVIGSSGASASAGRLGLLVPPEHVGRSRALGGLPGARSGCGPSKRVVDGGDARCMLAAVVDERLTGGGHDCERAVFQHGWSAQVERGYLACLDASALGTQCALGGEVSGLHGKRLTVERDSCAVSLGSECRGRRGGRRGRVNSRSWLRVRDVGVLGPRVTVPPAEYACRAGVRVPRGRRAGL